MTDLTEWDKAMAAIESMNAGMGRVYRIRKEHGLTDAESLLSHLETCTCALKELT